MSQVRGLHDRRRSVSLEGAAPGHQAAVGGRTREEEVLISQGCVVTTGITVFRRQRVLGRCPALTVAVRLLPIFCKPD